VQVEGQRGRAGVRRQRESRSPVPDRRPAGTSQKLRTVLIPMPMSDGHFTSGVIVLSGASGAALAAFAGAFFGALRVWRRPAHPPAQRNDQRGQRQTPY